MAKTKSTASTRPVNVIHNFRQDSIEYSAKNYQLPGGYYWTLDDRGRPCVEKHNNDQPDNMN